jgi:hypothetical protein
MVIDHVEDHCQTVPMAGLHQSLQAIGPAVRVLHRERIDTVITPVAMTRELGNGHELESSDPQRLELREVRNDGLERPLRGERPDVQLVQNVLPQRDPPPGAVIPVEMRVDHL